MELSCCSPGKRKISSYILPAALVLLLCTAIIQGFSVVTNSRLLNSLRTGDDSRYLPATNTVFEDKSTYIASYWWPSVSQGGVFGAISDVQHPKSCRNASLFVFRTTGREDRGLTAWGKTASAHFAHALSEGRTVISDQTNWTMARDCQVKTHECFFEPLSSCTLDDADPPEDDANAFVMEKSNDQYESDKVRTVYSTKTWFRPISDGMIFEGMGLGPEHNRLFYEAAALAYYFRPQPWLRQEIDRRLRQSIPGDLNPDQTIGLPLRRSDKCEGHNLTGHPSGEMDCAPLQDFVDACKKFVAFDPRITTVIVTSEDKEELSSLVAQLRAQTNLRIVTNVGDVQQGTGSSVHRVKESSTVTNHDIMASALTSIHMHLRARYLIITTQSSWTSSIAVLSRVYGFSSRDVLALDLRSDKSIFKSLARKGSA